MLKIQKLPKNVNFLSIEKNGETITKYSNNQYARVGRSVRSERYGSQKLQNQQKPTE